MSEAIDRLEVTLPLPPKALHPNARKHWRAKMKPKKQQRADAFWAAYAAIGMRNYPQWKLAEIQSTWYLARRNDQDNLIAWLKATADGLADAKVVGDDRGFIWLPPQQITGKAAKGERKVVLEIRERREAV